MELFSLQAKTILRSTLAISLYMLGMYPHVPLEALPTIDSVAHGTADAAIHGNELLIKASDSAILNYRNFEIQNHETVRFQMADASHRVLNRIHSESPSHIDGKLLSNGIVYLMNPAGLLFGPDCIVNVSALYAAAAHLSDQDFIQGIDHFKDVKGIIEVYGTLTAQEIALIGRSIVQNGTVNAEEGHIFFATAENVYFGKENGHLFLKCEKESLQQPAETSCFIETGTPEAFLLHHAGTSKAKKIHLYAEKDSLVKVSGTLDASQLAKDSTGGEVLIQGEVVSLQGAAIEASGTSGGGTVLIGGGRHGQGLYPTAQYTECDERTSIHADATGTGNGGNIILWADKATIFDAKVFSRGGSAGGDGGFIETSSGNHFRGIAGRVDTTAAKGNGGLWELDPNSITISSTLPQTPGILFGSTPPGLQDGTGSAYVVSPAFLEAASSSFILGATVPNPVGMDNTFISLGSAGSPETVNITTPNIGVVFSTLNGVGNGQFYANGSFTTTGPLTINAPVVLQGNTTFGSTSSTVTFVLTADSAPATNYNLTLNAAAGVIFTQAVGSLRPVGILNVQTPSAIVQCYSNIAAAGNIIFNSSLVNLNAPCSFTTTGGGISFSGTVNSDTPASNRNLTLSATGDIAFNSFVGLNPIGDLTINNANNVTLFSQSNPTLPPYTLTARSFTQTAGTGTTSFQGPLITFGAPVPQAGGTEPTAPQNGGNVSITTAGAINFYYLVGTGSLSPVLVPGPGDNVVIKSVITATGGRQSSSVSTAGNPNAPNGLNGGNVTLNGSSINLLGIYAGGTPAFPGSSGTGGKGGTVSITSTAGTALRGPIFVTGGAGTNGGAQDLPTLVTSGQNLNAAGSDSPGDITINGPLTLGFNGIILRGGDISAGAITGGNNLLGIDSSTAGTVSLGALNDLSYLAIDYSKGVAISGAVQADGIALFNTGSENITFTMPVTATNICGIANNFCAIFDQGYSASTATFLNCGCAEPPPPPPPGPPTPSNAAQSKGQGFSGVYFPMSNIFYSAGNVFSNDDSYLQVPSNVFFLNFTETPKITDNLQQ